MEMSRSLTRSLAALPLRRGPGAVAIGRPWPTTKTATTTTRLLSSTWPRRQDDGTAKPFPSQEPQRPRERLKDIFASSKTSADAPVTDPETDILVKALGKEMPIDTKQLSTGLGEAPTPKTMLDYEPHHLHVYSHRHNTHITFTKPNREPIISMSCGNLGYTKSRRGTFDSAYSLTKFVLERLVYTNVQFQRLEVVMRGFGPGREAATKLLMSPEGKAFREKIVRVSDATRIKFAGTRSKARRRV